MKRLTPVCASAVVAIMVFGGLIPLSMNVVAAIPIPHNMSGTPYDETGVRMDVGELITSWIDGVEYGRNDTFAFGPNITYDIDTDGNWVWAPGSGNSPWEKEGGDLNEPIMYVWGDMTMIDLDPEYDGLLNYGVFEETDLWLTADVEFSDLSLSIDVDQPPMFPKISMIVPEPTDGWPDYVLIYTEQPFYPMTGFYLEKNDGVLNGPSFALSGLSNATAYFYANLTTMDLDACGDELKLVWSNTGLAFGGNDIVVDRVEWNATTNGTHNVGLNHEPDNTIMTDVGAPACNVTDFAMRRDGVFPVFDTDTNDNLADFVLDTPWPRPVIGPPIVNWNIPVGGEDWTGGSTHQINWTVYDNSYINDLLTCWVNYSEDGGGSWNPASFVFAPNPMPGNGSALIPMGANWILPFADTTMAVLNVTCVNPDGLSSYANSFQFDIDSTPPIVDDTDPRNGTIEVPVDKDIEIYFSEQMDTAVTDTSFQITPDPGFFTVWAANNSHVTLSHNDFAQNTTYCVDVTTAAEDDSDPGNSMTATYPFCFTTYEPKAPTIDLTYPDGGQNWTGGSTDKVIWFNYTHADGLDLTRIWLNYSCGGSEFNIWTAIGLPVWGNPYPWAPLPLEDATDCYIHVVIADTDGDKLWDEDFSLDFTIDSTAPQVIGTNPLDDQGNVPVTTDVVVTFEEAGGMDRASVEAAWWMRTGTTDVTCAFSWSGGDTILTCDPITDLAYFTDYTITIDTGAKDKSDGGNFLAADYTFNFTTEHSPPPVVEVTSPDGSESPLAEGNSLFIEWTMSDVDTPTADLVVDVSYVFDTTTQAITQLTGELNHTWTVACPVSNADTSIQILVDVKDAEAQTSSNVSVPVLIDCTIPSATITYTGDLFTNQDIQFDTSDESETNLTYSWDLDGDTVEDSQLKNPTYQYGTASTYIVRLIVTDEAGNSGSATPVTLEIKAPVTPTDGRYFGIELWMWIIIIIVIVVVIALIAFAAKRKKKEPEEELPPTEEEEEEELVEEEEEEVYEEEEAPVEEEEELVEEEEVMEEEAAPEPAAPAPVVAPPVAAEPEAEEPAAGATKECPSCGSEVPADATECFLCGATL